MFKWLIRREHNILAFEKGEDGKMIFGHTDENTDSNVLEMFMAEAVPDIKSWYDLEYISISGYWKLFSRYEVCYREIFCHDLDP